MRVAGGVNPAPAIDDQRDATHPCNRFPAGSRLEESGADTVWQLLQIHQRQEIDGLEFAVDGWRPAEARGIVQIGAEEAR
jgi:hypothetical protein